MRLYRSADGSRFHVSTCRYAKLPLEWVWARDKSEQEIWGTWEFGVYPCRVCKPLGSKGVRP